MAGDKDFWDTVPWIVAVFGWGFTHVFSEARERRKEVRAQLDKAIEQLLSLEKSAREFHMADKYVSTKSHDITSAIATFERKLYRISCVDVDDLISRIIALRRSITLKNFDASDFSPQVAYSDVLETIAEASSSLEEALEVQYRMRYPNRFPYFRIPKWKSRRKEPRIF